MAIIEDIVATAQTLSPADRLRLIERLWESIPTPSWPAQHSDELAAAQRRLMESDARWMEPVPWPIVQRLVAESLRSSRPKVYSAPRRFDLATIFIVTVAYSLLFGGMTLLQFPPVASLAVAGFITFVGIGQAILFGGKKPRAASIIVGTVIYGLSMLVYWIILGPRMYAASELLVAGTLLIIGGGILGYLAGACVGAVFMLAEFMRRAVGSTTHAEVDAEVKDI
jgi:putative addiction module component (TIGR02574 family)